MSPLLHFMLAQQHIAELRRAAQRERLATQAVTDRRNSRESTPPTRLARLTARLTPSWP